MKIKNLDTEINSLRKKAIKRGITLYPRVIDLKVEIFYQGIGYQLKLVNFGIFALDIAVATFTRFFFGSN